MATRREREKQESQVANSCAMILASLLAKELGLEFKERKDNKPYVELLMTNEETGKKSIMRIDVLCRILEEV